MESTPRDPTAGSGLVANAATIATGTATAGGTTAAGAHYRAGGEADLAHPSAPRLSPSRHRERVGDDLDRTYQVLDEARVCHVGTVVDGWPHVIPTKRTVLDALVDRSAPNRSAACRPPTRKELAATAVLALPLTSPDTQVSVKVRQGGVIDEPEDLGLPYWAGVVPLRTVEDEPIPDPSPA